MEIEYDIGPQDMIDFNWHVYSSPARRKQRMTKLITFTALIAIPGLVLLDSQDPAVAFLGEMMLIGAGMIFATSLLLTPVLVRRQFAQYFPTDKPSALYGWRRMTMDSERVMQEGEFMVAGWKWPAVERIEVSNRLLLFFIAQSAALIVPRRAFADEAVLLTFVETAERFQRSVQRPAATI
jgi:hypothetical protein